MDTKHWFKPGEVYPLAKYCLHSPTRPLWKRHCSCSLFIWHGQVKVDIRNGLLKVLVVMPIPERSTLCAKIAVGLHIALSIWQSFQMYHCIIPHVLTREITVLPAICTLNAETKWTIAAFTSHPQSITTFDRNRGKCLETAGLLHYSRMTRSWTRNC